MQKREASSDMMIMQQDSFYYEFKIRLLFSSLLVKKRETVVSLILTLEDDIRLSRI